MADGARRLGADVAAGSLFAFVVLGLPDGMLGVAWPAIRHDLGKPLAGLGELLLASLAGYLLVTAFAGTVLKRTGAPTALVLCALTASAGAALFVGAHMWSALVAGATLLGAAGGGLDAALNTVVALGGRVRFMNLLHAAYGVGAAAGPLVVTAALNSRSSWRAAYGLLLFLEAGLVVVWIALRYRLSSLAGDRGSPASNLSSQPDEGREDKRAACPEAKPVRTLGTRRLRGIFLLSLTVFFFYTGLEVAVASWSASFLRESGGFSASGAGLVVFAYWAGLTAGRVGAAGVGTRLSAERAVSLGALGALVGAGLVWADASRALTVAALVLIGLSLGPIFPAIVNLTPRRLGATAAVNAVGWQLSAAAVGGASVSAAVGLVLQKAGLDSFGVSLLTLALVLVCLNLALEKAASKGVHSGFHPESGG